MQPKESKWKEETAGIVTRIRWSTNSPVAYPPVSTRWKFWHYNIDIGQSRSGRKMILGCWRSDTNTIWRIDVELMRLGIRCFCRLYGVSRLMNMKIDHALRTALVEQWCQNSHILPTCWRGHRDITRCCTTLGLRIDCRAFTSSPRHGGKLPVPSYWA